MFRTGCWVDVWRLDILGSAQATTTSNNNNKLFRQTGAFWDRNQNVGLVNHILKEKTYPCSSLGYFVINREFKHGVYGRRQTAKITSDFLFFSCYISLNKSHKNGKMSLTIHCKYKCFDSTVQGAEDCRRQKFHFCRLPFEVTSCLTSLMITIQ